MRANPFAGEVVLQLDGQEHRCKLTLGALAELETTLEAGTLIALISRFESEAFSASDIFQVIYAGLRGGGWRGRAEDLITADIGGGPVEAARVAAQLLHVAFTPPGAE